MGVWRNGSTGLFAVLAMGCGAADLAEGEDTDVNALSATADCEPSTSDKCAKKRSQEGKRLFDAETFGGNGRRCVTCHQKDTGTFSPEDAQARLAADPSDPLFVHDGLDDGVSGTARITQHATVRVEIPLPPHITLADDPSATSVVFHRGTPSTLNTPALDAILMVDGRAPNLQEQALGAIERHAQSVIEPTALELDLIADFQQHDERFFSTDALADFAAGGPPPALPAGTTDSEMRGRAMFEDVPFSLETRVGICAMCHSGPMLNRTNFFNPFAPPGVGFGTAEVSQRNVMGNPEYTFLIDNGGGFVVAVTTPDPGVVLTDPLPPVFPPFLPKSFSANFFKIPTLWGVAHTAPYFHDNSAKSLDDIGEHYTFFFKQAFGLELTGQDRGDIAAFLNLL